LKVAQDSFLIGLIGRYHPVKDHDNFLKAAALLLKTHPDTQFVLCGKQVDSKNRSLGELIHNLQITEQVHLLGERHDIPRITAALDVSASSSRTEGFPNVIGEAMSSGVPCVATDVSDLAVILGETGRIVPPGNPVALATALAELIEIGPEGRAALGARARSRIVAHYSLDEEVAQYETIYERAIAKAKAQKMAAIGDQIAAMPDPSG
jgi:glycosyltransferase involved in cell wall biosynthesis